MTKSMTRVCYTDTACFLGKTNRICKHNLECTYESVKLTVVDKLFAHPGFSTDVTSLHLEALRNKNNIFSKFLDIKNTKSV
jgi:hypothetical protein